MAAVRQLSFEKVIGQRRIKEILSTVVKRGRLAHAYLFCGPEGVGKDAMALELARALNCTNDDLRPCGRCQGCKMMATLQHPDVKFIFPLPSKAKDTEVYEKMRQKAEDPYREIGFAGNVFTSIERIRELRRETNLHHFGGKYRLAIISEADKMTLEACNALLKILEEPPPGMILLLTTAKMNLLPTTIVSRCQILRFNPLKEEEIETALLERGLGSQKARLIARLAMGSFRKALQLWEEDLDTARNEALEFLRTGFNGGGIERLELVERLTAQKNRGKVKNLLSLLLLLVRDISILCELKDPNRELIINEDITPVLSELAGACDFHSWERVIHEIEKAIDLIEKNIYINLILIVLLNKFMMLRGR